MDCGIKYEELIAKAQDKEAESAARETSSKECDALPKPQEECFDVVQKDPTK